MVPAWEVDPVEIWNLMEAVYNSTEFMCFWSLREEYSSVEALEEALIAKPLLTSR